MSNNTQPPQADIPRIGLRAYIADLAAQHGVTPLAGDGVKHDETKRLVIALRRANVIDRKIMTTFLRRYFEEQKREQLYAAMEQGTPVYDGLPFLKERQRKDAEEVRAGLRSARSLVMFPEGWLKGATFTANPNSEFSRPRMDTDANEVPPFVTRTTLAEHFEMKPGDTLTAILSRRPKPHI